ncbi:MAG: hypothetical protein Q4G67_09595 [Actinomycetia bacterium]|nr:hypothetical protein [Actinomycetes bacterium]
MSIAALILAGLSALYALLFVVGSNGLGWLTIWDLPRNLGFRFFIEPFQVPSFLVHVDGEAGVQTAAAANALVPPLTDSNPNGAPPGTVEFFGDLAFVSVWAMEPSWTAAWLLSRILPAAGLAVVWWLLYRIARGTRSEMAWSTETARRLRIMALLVGVGGPLAALAKWAVDGWIVGQSTAADLVRLADLRIPLWTIAAGLALLMAATLVDRARAMADDLDGLV